MSAVRLYMDEDSGELAVILGLRARGIDVLTTQEAHREGSDDSEQLAFAAAQGRVLVSYNVGDFARLHGEYLSQGIGHAGIILMPGQRHSVGGKIRRLANFISRVTPADMISRLEFV